MATIRDITIINSNVAPTRTVASGLERTLCESPTLSVYRRTVSQTPIDGVIHYGGGEHAAEEGAGVLLVPGETARIAAVGSDFDLLHMVVPKPPPAVEEGLPGGPGYFFNRRTLRGLSDASGGRVRRFCAESSVRLVDGRRLTPTNAIQAGEMHYKAGGASPYHMHQGTTANPAGAAHCYITFAGRGIVEVGDTSQEIEPGTLVSFPPGVPHRLRSHGGSLDYFEIQAWRSFKTTILSEEPLGLKWFYERDKPDAPLLEWNQS